MSCVRSQKGFTLLELIIAIAVMAILMAIATPSFNTWRAQASLKAEAREVLGSFQRARSEAVTRNTLIVLSFSEGSGSLATWKISDSAYPDGAIAKGEMKNGVQISGVSFTDKKASVDARGLPLEGGSVAVTDGRSTYKITLTAAGSVKIERI